MPVAAAAAAAAAAVVVGHRRGPVWTAESATHQSVPAAAPMTDAAMRRQSQMAVLTTASNVLDERCAEIGRNPAEIERSIGVNPRKLELGDEYLALGATQFTLGFSGPDYDLAPVPDWIAWRDGL